MLLDLDGFKGVNDTSGHATGDEVLRMIADRLQHIAAPHAFVARLGGDEFVLLLTRPRDCSRLDEVVLSVLRSLRHVVDRDGKQRGVSATVSAAYIKDDVAAPNDLTHRADLALYNAKRSQRATGRVFGNGSLIRNDSALRLVEQ